MNCVSNSSSRVGCINNDQSRNIDQVSYDNLDKDDRHFLREAIKVASENITRGGGPFGAIIVNKEKQVIARIGNSVTKTNDPTAHAEVNAIR